MSITATRTPSPTIPQQIIDALIKGDFQPARRFLRQFFTEHPNATSLPPHVETVAAYLLVSLNIEAGVNPVHILDPYLSGEDSL